MTASEIAIQQVHAAWISADAAVIQAIGALGAIGVSVYLAFASGRRERKTQSDSEKRIEAAATAAEARAIQIENDAHNQLINQITSLGKVGLVQCQHISYIELSMISKPDEMVVGSLKGDQLFILQKTLPLWIAQTSDIKLVSAMTSLQNAIDLEQFQGSNRYQYMVLFQLKAKKIEDTINRIEKMRR